MESWALLDLATALDESSSSASSRPRPGVVHHHPHQARQAANNKPAKKSSRRRTKSTGNIGCGKVGGASSSTGEMEDPDQAHYGSSIQQTETDEGGGEPARKATPSSSSLAGPSTPWFAMPPAVAGPSSMSSLVPSGASSSPALVQLATQAPLSVAESDSLNETISPLRPHTRRKRRFKRMAVDPEPVVSQQLDQMEGRPSCGFPPFTSIFAKPIRQQRKPKKKPLDLQKVPNVTIGKRKRSVREPSIECELEKISLNSSPDEEEDSGRPPGGLAGPSSSRSLLGASGRPGGPHHRHSLRHGHALGDSMDMDMKQQLEQVSSSSVSGSESDPGFYTFDDGREADDEQSDWYQESGSTWGPPIPTAMPPSKPLWWVEEDPGNSSGEEDPAGLLRGPSSSSSSWQQPSSEGDSKDAFRLRMQKLRDRIPGREIRAGRRHLGAQRGPACSILTSANEKLSRFLQDPGQSELRLHPMQKSERDQLSHLAQLYSLQMLSEGARGLKCPVLKKTRNTMQAVRIDMDRSPSLWTDFKRQRKTPPASVTSESALDEAPFADESSSSNGSNQQHQRSRTPPRGEDDGDHDRPIHQSV